MCFPLDDAQLNERANIYAFGVPTLAGKTKWRKSATSMRKVWYKLGKAGKTCRADEFAPRAANKASNRNGLVQPSVNRRGVMSLW
jgi:hypothetical protein